MCNLLNMQVVNKELMTKYKNIHISDQTNFAQKRKSVLK